MNLLASGLDDKRHRTATAIKMTSKTAMDIESDNGKAISAEMKTYRYYVI